MIRIACVGHAALDHVFEVEQIPGGSSKTLARRYQALAGGMALHASIAAARLGASVRLLGRVGEDAAADFLRRRIAAEGVEPRGLASVRGGSTSLASVIVDAQLSTTPPRAFLVGHPACRSRARRRPLPASW